jgi:hypothetical protein
MALTRGPSSNYPCPRCLIRADQQGVYPPVCAPARTSATTQEDIKAAREMRVGAKEEHLKGRGLRDVDVRAVFSFVNLSYDIPQQNVFWKIENSDPYQSLSFDRLHTFPGGIFRHHLWTRLQTYVQSLGKEASDTVNATYVSFV